MFIVRGMIRLTFQGEELRSSPMKGGDFFGVICLAGLADTRPYTTTAMRQCELCTLSRNDMRRLVAQHPQIGDVVMEFARQRLREITQDVNEAKTTIEHTKSRKDVVRRMREHRRRLELASMTDMKGRRWTRRKRWRRRRGTEAHERALRSHPPRAVRPTSGPRRGEPGLMKLRKRAQGLSRGPAATRTAARPNGATPTRRARGRRAGLGRLSVRRRASNRSATSSRREIGARAGREEV